MFAVSGIQALRTVGNVTAVVFIIHVHFQTCRLSQDDVCPVLADLVGVDGRIWVKSLTQSGFPCIKVRVQIQTLFCGCCQQLCAIAEREVVQIFVIVFVELSIALDQLIRASRVVVDVSNIWIVPICECQVLVVFRPRHSRVIS